MATGGKKMKYDIEQMLKEAEKMGLLEDWPVSRHNPRLLETPQANFKLSPDANKRFGIFKNFQPERLNEKTPKGDAIV